MIFLNSNFLLFMILPLIILGFFIVTNKRYINRIFDSKILEKLIIRRNYLGIFGKNMLLFLTLFLFIIALSRPVLPKDEVKLHSKVPSYAILLDISASMKASDIYPDRLTFAKKKIEKLLKSTTAKLSFYCFSDKLYKVAPKTTNLTILSYLVKHLDIPQNLSKSSNLFNAIKNIKEKSIIIFTDGTDIKDFSKIKTLKKDIIVYLTATKTPTPIRFKNGYLKNQDGEIVLTSANYAIKEIGRVILFSHKDSDMKTLLTSSKSVTFSIKEFKKLYHYPLYLATITLFFALFSPRRVKMFALLITLFYISVSSNALFLDFLDINKAQKAYQDGDYKRAVKYFKKVIKEKKSPQSFYNLANAYYKDESYKLALQNYKRVVTKSKELKYKTFFNIANCYFKLKNYNQAFNFYNLAKSIKTTKKVEKNLQIVQKLIDTNSTKKDFTTIMVSNQKDKKLDDFKIKTLLIELTKGDSNDTINPW